jgi:hypothetical protein
MERPALARRAARQAWTADLAAKAPVIAGFRRQVEALFPSGEIPVRPETYYASRVARYCPASCALALGELRVRAR